jgi:uncharacterized membrane protein
MLTSQRDRAKLSNHRNIYSNPVDLFILLAVTLLAAILRVRGIDAQGYWFDEFYTLANLVGFDLYLFPTSDLKLTSEILPAKAHLIPFTTDYFFPNIWRTILHEGPLPPLYMILLKIWTLITAYSPYSVRFFSVITSTLTIPIIYLLGLRLGERKVAIFVSLFFATSPFQIYFAIEARNYSLLIFFSTLATLSAITLTETEKLKNSHWMSWTLSVLFAIMTHYYAVIYCFFILTLYVLPKRIIRDGSNLIPLFLKGALPFIIFLLWLPVLYLQVNAHGDDHWTEGALTLSQAISSSALTLIKLLRGPASNINYLEYTSFSLLILISFINVIITKNSSTRSSSRTLITVIFASLGFVYLLDLIIDQHTISVVRYSICLAIPLTLVICISMHKLGVIGSVFSIILIAFSINTSILIADGKKMQKQMLREVSSHIKNVYRPGDIVVVTPNGPSMIGIAYYLDNDIMMTAVAPDLLDNFVSSYDRPDTSRIWSVQQRLGIKTESWALKSTPKAKSVIRFVGVDFAEY